MNGCSSLSNFFVAMKNINDIESELPFLCSSPCVVIDAMKYSSKVCRFLSFKIYLKCIYAGQMRCVSAGFNLL